MSFVWRVYHRPKPLGSHPDAFKEPPAVHLGFVTAPTSSEALDVAAGRFTGYSRLRVVADVAWRFLSALERAVFLGTFQPPAEVEAASRGDVRISVCKVCGQEIAVPVRPTDDGRKMRIGRPKRYHDECAPPHVRKWREREARCVRGAR